jgi:predicted DNA-binding transcriptional regulator AlpA
MTEELLTPRQVEEEYGFRVQTLAQWRWMGLGPDYLKLSPGKGGRIKYRQSAIEAWLKECTVQAGSAA